MITSGIEKDEEDKVLSIKNERENDDKDEESLDKIFETQPPPLPDQRKTSAKPPRPDS